MQRRIHRLASHPHRSVRWPRPPPDEVGRHRCRRDAGRRRGRRARAAGHEVRALGRSTSTSAPGQLDAAPARRRRRQLRRVDRCRRRRDPRGRGFRRQRVGPQRGPRLRRGGAVLVQVSTDYVFDGRRPSRTRPTRRSRRSTPTAGPKRLASGRRGPSARQSYVVGRPGCTASTDATSSGRCRAARGSAGDPRGGRRPARPTDLDRDLAARIETLVTGDEQPGIHHVTNSGTATWSSRTRGAHRSGAAHRRPPPGPHR